MIEIKLTFIAHCFSSFAMFGVIWIVQLVHYPIFKYIDERSFKDFEQIHINRISFVVVPLMLLELLSGFYLYFMTKENIYFTNLLLMGGIWLVTLFYSIPAHKKLMSSKSIPAIDRLVRTNWARTSLWSVRAFLLINLMLNWNIYE